MNGTQSTIALDMMLGNPYKSTETHEDKNENKKD